MQHKTNIVLVGKFVQWETIKFSSTCTYRKKWALDECQIACFAEKKIGIIYCSLQYENSLTKDCKNVRKKIAHNCLGLKQHHAFLLTLSLQYKIEAVLGWLDMNKNH